VADSPLAIWSVFIGGVLAAVILLAGFVAAVVLSQRRYLNLHRAHARQVLEAQEQERAWVSREVHDDAVQRVALIGRECAAVAESGSGVSREQGEQLRAIQNELRDLGTFLRRLAHRLHPPLIDRGGLPAALAALCKEVGQTHAVQVEHWIPSDDTLGQLSPQSAIALYRIAQEALQNVAKHAATTTATLELVTSPDTVELVIRDQGWGFNTSKNHRPPGGEGGGGIGLMSMKERAVLAGGEVAVTSSPGAGTEVRARIPVRPAGQEA